MTLSSVLMLGLHDIEKHLLENVKVKIVFNHVEGFGKIKSQDLIYTPVIGYLEPTDDAENLLDNGWLPWEDYWFQARSVRCSLLSFHVSKTTKKLAKRITYKVGSISLSDMNEIGSVYSNKKNILSSHVFNNKDISKNAIQYFYEDKLIGFVCYKIFVNSFIGIQFAWDYAKPSLSLGNISTYIESIVALENNCKHYYIMGGYEECCLYKKELKGFEWWTGSNWSNDKDLYKSLCIRDSKIEILNLE